MSNLKNTFKNSKVLITGHTGFKGSWLTIWLKKLEAEIYGISNNFSLTDPSHFKSTGIANKIHNFNVDIRNFEKISQTIEDIKPDFIFHLAAQPLVSESYKNPLDTWQTNAIGTLNILESLKSLKNKCVSVFITSDKCYENVEWEYGYRENDKLGGIDPYSSSKAAAEIAISSYIRSFFIKDENIRIGIARAGNVIGGGDWAQNRIIPDCIRSWAKNKTVLLRNPNSTRPWQHVLEPLSGYLNLAINLNESNKLHGEAFNFGPPPQQSPSVEDLVKTMANYWEKVNWEVNSNSEIMNFHEAGLLKLNCDKAIKFLNWHSSWDFITTVEMTASWYRDFYKKGNENNILKITNEQIKKYTEDAKSKNLFWAE